MKFFKTGLMIPDKKGGDRADKGKE